MKKRFSIMLACTLVLSLLAGCGDAGGSHGGGYTPTTGGQSVPTYEYVFRDLPEAKYITPAQAFAGGTGTQEDPYQIADGAQLALIHAKLSDRTDTEMWTHYNEACYVLTADIALNDTTHFDSWETNGPEYQWIPIGMEQGMPFSGVLDGAGHTITGMYINTNSLDDAANYGLIANCRGTVKDLTLDQSYVEVSGNSDVVGTIVGTLWQKGLVENCVSNADLRCYDSTLGGVVGSALSAEEGEYEDMVSTLSTVRNCAFGGTITQMKPDSLSRLGGIAGNSRGEILNCVNSGTIVFGAGDVDAVGGITAVAGNGLISDCENAGMLKCAVGEETDMARVGGIVGLLNLTATGTKRMSHGVTVQNCTNSGTVEGWLYAGGIVGSANNDHNDYCLTVSGCTNTGVVTALNYNGGIIGYLTCTGNPDHGNNVVVENCENQAELTTGTAGGIIGQFLSEKGNVLIQDCTNTGNLTSEGQNCAGIIGYWLMNSNPDNCSTIVKDCANTGNIHSHLSAGGIVSYMDFPVALEVKTASITISGCTNGGQLTVDAINGYIGGILGCWGMENIPTTVESCTNTGDLNITHVLSEGALEEDPVMVISRIAGGIVGRAGPGLLLTTGNDESIADNIQSGSAILRVHGCENTGTAHLADDTESQVFRNFLGGIIGNASGGDGYSLLVSDSVYTGFERGLGNVDLPDVGKKQ